MMFRASWRESVPHITAHEHCDRAAVGPGERECDIDGRANHRRTRLLAVLYHAQHPMAAALLSPCVAGAGRPCHAPLSPQPVDATALSKKPPGWHGFCPCLFAPPRWCSLGRAWQHTPHREPGAPSAGAERTGRRPCRVAGISDGHDMPHEEAAMTGKTYRYHTRKEEHPSPRTTSFAPGKTRATGRACLPPSRPNSRPIPPGRSSWRSRRCTRRGPSRASGSSPASEPASWARQITQPRANAAVSGSAAPRRQSPATAGLGDVAGRARARVRIAGSLAQAPQKEERQ
jgi:hypothetical protein